jgi:hypothetical protein
MRLQSGDRGAAYAEDIETAVTATASGRRRRCALSLETGRAVSVRDDLAHFGAFERDSLEDLLAHPVSHRPGGVFGFEDQHRLAVAAVRRTGQVARDEAGRLQTRHHHFLQLLLGDSASRIETRTAIECIVHPGQGAGAGEPSPRTRSTPLFTARAY